MYVRSRKELPTYHYHTVERCIVILECCNFYLANFHYNDNNNLLACSNTERHSDMDSDYSDRDQSVIKYEKNRVSLL